MSDVSLIIATYEEEESLEFVLNELSNFIFNEIIIVDNNSKDNTLKIAKKRVFCVFYQQHIYVISHNYAKLRLYVVGKTCKKHVFWLFWGSYFQPENEKTSFTQQGRRWVDRVPPPPRI